MFDAARKDEDEEGGRWTWERGRGTVCREDAKRASIREAAAILESSRDTRESMRLAGVVLC